MSADEVRVVADGRSYTAKQALNVNLIDNIGDLYDARNIMMDSMTSWGLRFSAMSMPLMILRRADTEGCRGTG